MALTREFKETVQARARTDLEFRKALLKEAVDAMLAGEVDVGKAVLRDYINFVPPPRSTTRVSPSFPKQIL